MKRLRFLISILALLVFVGAGCNYSTGTDTATDELDIDALIEDALDEAYEDSYNGGSEYAFWCDEAIIDCEDVMVDTNFLDEPETVYFEDGTEEELYYQDCDDDGFCYVEDFFGTGYYVQL